MTTVPQFDLAQHAVYQDRIQLALQVLQLCKADLEMRMELGRYKIQEAKVQNRHSDVVEMEQRYEVYSQAHKRLTVAQHVVDGWNAEEIHDVIDQLL